MWYGNINFGYVYEQSIIFTKRRRKSVINFEKYFKSINKIENTYIEKTEIDKEDQALIDEILLND